MGTQADNRSLTSSIELKDALVDSKWFRPGETHSTKPMGNIWIKRARESKTNELEDYSISRRPFYARWYKAYKDRSLNERVQQFDEDELQNFVRQKIFRVRSFIHEEKSKLLLITETAPKSDCAQNADASELRRKYGPALIQWVEEVNRDLNQPSSTIIQNVLESFTWLKTVDPLSNWTQQDDEFCSRMIQRINIFASAMADMVKYSFIIEPGTVTPHLSEYVAEFRQLETFFERNQLSPGEAEQNAFNRNYLKARNRLLECADETRVVLWSKKAAEETKEDIPFSYRSVPRGPSYLLHADDIMGLAESVEQIDESDDDFIHASYVRGGPLMNTFILTQAPMPSTINDFWRMVYQERSKYIIMLCEAVDIACLGLLDAALPSSCPYYWPRYMKEKFRYGDYIVENVGTDCTIDPLFTVTKLSIHRADDSHSPHHTLQHWQFDWKELNDFYWPFRVLRRARMSPTPTIVHCLDGCGRSGTLVTIEALLMHLLRGSARQEKLVLTTAIFVRLQRRHAIASPQQYLYIYRTLLYWMQPYITSNVTRFILGLIYPEWGFVGKYEKMIACHRKI